ncbi:uncharacterized protein LOC101846599 [Aplysia californica]|uniref:Uncharacterized protein LOC101846599 n=1 Tax=Aplysia californica TaxID=6500 RepID=A0ABM0JXT7_APLCA|nr:uncharacterized protein LOC101846599 [Aplysia californica]XP_005104069.1 uncharacterized protein LOC101846599 [Aplysia californica]XP_005104070.1 uncharacterized protein LOC101846599 [Aplysia californica]
MAPLWPSPALLVLAVVFTGWSCHVTAKSCNYTVLSGAEADEAVRTLDSGLLLHPADQLTPTPADGVGDNNTGRKLDGAGYDVTNDGKTNANYQSHPSKASAYGVLSPDGGERVGSTKEDSEISASAVSGNYENASFERERLGRYGDRRRQDGEIEEEDVSRVGDNDNEFNMSLLNISLLSTKSQAVGNVGKVENGTGNHPQRKPEIITYRPSPNKSNNHDVIIGVIFVCILVVCVPIIVLALYSHRNLHLPAGQRGDNNNNNNNSNSYSNNNNKGDEEFFL